MQSFFTKHREVFILCFVIILILLFFIFLPTALSNYYSNDTTALVLNNSTPTSTPKEIVFTPSYIETPNEVKGIYMTSWVAGSPDIRSGLVKLISETEINSIVIDIKDYSGKLVFPIVNKELKAYGSEDIRVKDLQDFIEMLHKKGVYVIGRVAVFQDAYFVRLRPDLAVKNKAGTQVWKDRKGISWIDAGSKEYWDYIILIAEESRKIGFDEINFDYIRFPSDGNMQDISYPWSSTTPKSIVLKNFFEYLSENLKDSGLKTSADLFGMTTSATDDMGIGQILENALPYFDYISPMVYPSHYPENFEGYKNPEAHPYEIINLSMKSAIDRANIMDNGIASTSPNTPLIIGKTASKLRPWLQDFGLKMTYGANEVRAQIKATNDLGLSSWLLWSASNKYTRGALNNE